MRQLPIQIDEPLTVKSSDAAYAETLRSLLDSGLVASYSKSLSIGSEKTFLEKLNFSLQITDPRQRLVLNRARRINLPAAVARFVWMMAGSDRLADIAFYEPKVRAFTDDGVSVPGSNYGERMLQPRPGLNQLQAVIARMRENPGTRRAAISIYHPEDATRNSRDIPCTFGLAYHVRRAELLSTTIMRSNNAFILLPYNLFEFTLLAEAVAVEVGVPLGRHSYYALSMHLYERDYEAARKVVDSFDTHPEKLDIEIPLMPSDPSPLEQIRQLIILEADLRHGSGGLSENNIEEWISLGEERLNSYWRQYYYLLLFYVAQKINASGALETLESVVEEPWRSYLPEDSFKTASLAPVVTLFPEKEQTRIVLSHSTRVHQSLRERASDYETASGMVVSWREFVALEENFGDRLAARAGVGITEEEFLSALEELRGNED